MGRVKMSNPTNNAREELHRVLWEQTLRNAMRTPFYAKLWKHLDLGALIVAGPKSLTSLPTISKEDIWQAGEEARTPSISPRHHVLTGGTTGVPMRIMRSEEEIQFLHNFFIPEKLEKRMKRGLVFTAPYHGTQVPIQTHVHSHKINIYDAHSFDYALDVLLAEHIDTSVETRCSFIAGQERVLHAFSLFLQDRKVDPSTFALEFACSQGFHVSPTSRQRIETSLNCILIDRYSMSEVFGGASQEVLSDWYKPDPHVIFEIVHPRTAAPLQSGVGELVVTALYPFQQLQPMVRYRTGDLADAPDGAYSAMGLKHFRPLGRCKFSIFAPDDGHVVLPASALHNCLFEYSLAKRAPMFLDAPTSVTDPLRAGVPPFRLSPFGNNTTWILEIISADGVDPKVSESVLFNCLLNHPLSRLKQVMSEGRIQFAVRAVPHFLN